MYGDKPLVSICCIAFNHENFIDQAIGGFLRQITKFEIEIIIHDDASSDSTARIIQGYANEHPGLIFPIVQTVNQYSQGKKPLLDFVFPRAVGKYLAVCEGDDYWIDPYKLQKQVDFLETHPEYVFSFHDSIILNQRTGEKRMRIGDRQIENTVDLKSLIIQNNIPTASIVFRNFLDYAQLPDWIGKISKGDYGLCVLLAEEGPGKYLPEAMSVYRIHEGGVWSSKGFEFTHSANIIFYKYLLDYFTDSEIRQAIRTKMQWSEFNYGISKIRHGSFIKGLFLVVTNLRLHGDYRLRTNPRKIASAFKTLLKKNHSG